MASEYPMLSNIAVGHSRDQAYAGLKAFFHERKGVYGEAISRLDALLRAAELESRDTTTCVNWILRALEQRSTLELTHAIGVADTVGGQLNGNDGVTMCAKQNKVMAKFSKTVSKEQYGQATPKSPARKDKKKLTSANTSASEMPQTPRKSKKKMGTVEPVIRDRRHNRPLDIRDRPQKMTAAAEALSHLLVEEARIIQEMSNYVSDYLKETVKPKGLEFETQIFELQDTANECFSFFKLEVDKVAALYNCYERIHFKGAEFEKVSSGGKVKGVREDLWLAEQRYVNEEKEAEVAMKKAVEGVHVFSERLLDIESVRSKWLKDVLNTVLGKGYIPNMERIKTIELSLLNTINCYSEEHASFANYLRAFLNSRRIPTEPITAGQAKEAINVSYGHPQYLEETERLLRFSGVPGLGSNIVHCGTVQYSGGVLKKNLEGYMVLTSDKFVHLFENETSRNPVWTVNGEYAAVRFTPKGKQRSLLEVQEVKPGLFNKKKKHQVSGSNDEEMMKWVLEIKKFNKLNALVTPAEPAAPPNPAAEPVPPPPPATVPEETLKAPVVEQTPEPLATIPEPEPAKYVGVSAPPSGLQTPVWSNTPSAMSLPPESEKSMKVEKPVKFEKIVQDEKIVKEEKDPSMTKSLETALNDLFPEGQKKNKTRKAVPA